MGKKRKQAKRDKRLASLGPVHVRSQSTDIEGIAASVTASLRDMEPPTPPGRKPVKVSSIAPAMAKARGAASREDKAAPDVNPFVLPEYPRGVLPKAYAKRGKTPGHEQLAMDAEPLGVVRQALDYGTGWHGLWSEGIGFMGYPYLAELAQRVEYQRAASVFAGEMTRKWVKLKAKGEKDKSAEISDLEEAFEFYKVREVFREAIELDCYFGRGQIFVDVGDREDNDEMMTPLAIKPEKIGKGGLNRLTAIDPTWTAPNNYNSRDPTDPTFYRPQSWFVMGREIHHTRLLTMVARPLRDLLKPAYNFGGLSLSQVLKPYVDNWLRTRQAISDLVNAFNVFVLGTNLSGFLAGGDGTPEMNRIDTFNFWRNNLGTLAIDPEAGETFQTVAAPLSGLDHLQAQTQEHLSSATGIPLVKLLGITPSGLNACLTGDTLIETDRGQVPIRDVTTSDQVMTRAGWAPLAWSGCTGYATELIEIGTEKQTLRCTANHPIWSPSTNAFVPAGNVRPGLCLLYRGETDRSQGMVNQSRGADDGGGMRRAATMRRPSLATSRCCSIERFGKFITDLSRMAFKSITSTMIQQIISSAISNCCRLATMPTSMAALSGSSCLNQPYTSTDADIVAYRSSRLSPRGQSFAAIGAGVRMRGQAGYRRQSLNRSVFASYAGPLSRRFAKMRSIALGAATSRAKASHLLSTIDSTINSIRKNGLLRLFVARNVAASNASNASATASRNHASFAASNSSIDRVAIGSTAAKTVQRQRIVVESVRRVNCEPTPVYDLTVGVGHLPEFFANGMCVHNSSEGEVRTFYDLIHSEQERVCGPSFDALLQIIQISLWGKVDPDITYEWVSLWELDEVQQSQRRKTDADTGAVLIAGGVIDPEEERIRIAQDVATPYAGLDLSKMPEPPEEPDEEDGGGKADNENEPRSEAAD